MKSKRTIFLTAVVVALGLLLGAGTTQAATVILDGDNVIRIENLRVYNARTTEQTYYNVNFDYIEASDAYTDDLVYEIPCTDAGGCEDAYYARWAVEDALNGNDPVPLGAGPNGDRTFWIGYRTVKPEPLLIRVEATGSEIISEHWDRCSKTCDPVQLLDPDVPYTYARFTEVSGPPPVTIGGNVTGLAGSGLVLQNNYTDDLPIDVDGGFTFDTPLIPGSSYNVTVLTQPEGQTCEVQNGNGTVPTEDVTNVVVTCTVDTEVVYIGGTVTGLVSSGLVLQNNGTDDLPIDVDSDFTFDTPLAPGSSYNVTVLTQPAGQTCEVQNGSGEVPDVDVTNVAVSCAEPLCDGKVVTHLGSQEANEITGTDGPDVIHGLGGGDTIHGLGGDDVICGGDGSDYILAGLGNDIVFGENGDDSIWGADGDDILRGGDGNDSLYGNNGDDLCYGDPGMVSWECEQFIYEPITPAPLPKTGQTETYRSGDDGELQKGVEWPRPRFTDNGNGTVTDHLTGLIWLKNADCFGERNWSDALDASNNLANGDCDLSDGSVAGDWRLPNVSELHGLIDFANSYPALPSDHPFTGVQPRNEYQTGGGRYWSSTTQSNNTGQAFVVAAGEIGKTYVITKGVVDAMYVWPVRGGIDN